MTSLRERAVRSAVAAFTVVLGTGILAITAPASAQAAVACNPTWSKPNGDGYIVAWQDYNLKNGPYGDCGHTGKIKKGTKFFLWCKTTNTYGNDWWYGRIDGTSTMGWAFQDAIFGPKVVEIPDDNNDGIVRLAGCGPRTDW
jgi:hypothetical protein